jgi:hypothetical protein
MTSGVSPYENLKTHYGTTRLQVRCSVDIVIPATASVMFALTMVLMTSGVCPYEMQEGLRNTASPGEILR